VVREKVGQHNCIAYLKEQMKKMSKGGAGGQKEMIGA